jgi:hypothetical protein
VGTYDIIVGIVYADTQQGCAPCPASVGVTSGFPREREREPADRILKLIDGIGELGGVIYS